MTFKLGLTGSIGMGKSTTAKLFADEGCAVWDADAAVHRLYSAQGNATQPIGSLFPDALVDGAVSRTMLRSIIQHDSTALRRIEQIIHPLVAKDRQQFLAKTEAPIAVFDIPLLFETGGEKEFDAVACVLVDDEIQRERVMTRGTMSERDLELILSKQLPAQEKAARADFVIQTDTLEHARNQVADIVAQIKNGWPDA